MGFHSQGLDLASTLTMYRNVPFSNFAPPSAGPSFSLAKLTRDGGLPTFTASAFSNLLEMLQVPFFRTEDVSTGPALGFIGGGGFAKVTYDEIKTQDPTKPVSVAIKALSPITPPLCDMDIPSTTISQAFCEICIMKHPNLLEHPNILKFIGLKWGDDRIIGSSNSLQLSLLTEYADLGSLDSYLQFGLKMDWKIKLDVLNDITSGLHALHQCDIVHNDVKSANVFLFSRCESHERIFAKVGDFGCSVPLAMKDGTRGPAGSQVFAPPEAYSSDCPVLPSRDVYSFGLIILHIATESRPPFLEMTVEDAWETKADAGAMARFVKAWLPPSSAPFIAQRAAMRALRLQPEERLNLNDITALWKDEYSSFTYY